MLLASMGADVHYDSDLGFHCLCSWFLPLLSQLSHITIIHSPFRRGWQLWAGLELPHTLPSPLRGEGVAHTSIHQHITLFATPIFSSQRLSSLLACYSSTTPLFFHTHLPHTLIQLTHAWLFKATYFLIKLSLWQHHSGTIASGWHGCRL